MASGVANFEPLNLIKNLRGGIERAKRGRRWMPEGSPSEVKFTLLKGHEARRGKETRPGRERA